MYALQSDYIMTNQNFMLIYFLFAWEKDGINLRSLYGDNAVIRGWNFFYTSGDLSCASEIRTSTDSVYLVANSSNSTRLFVCFCFFYRETELTGSCNFFRRK